MKRFISIWILLFLAESSVFSQETDMTQVMAKIKVDQKENMLHIHAIVGNENSLYLSYDYLLLVKKIDKQKNLSINKQSGPFTLEPNEEKELSAMRINQNENTTIKAYLYIRDQEKNKLITKDSVEIEPRHIQLKHRKPISLTDGMIINQTKTKFGKDFYDELFSKYNQIPEKYKFIISINEKPFRGITSLIEIKADRDLIYQFPTNPNEEYRKKQVDITLRRLKIFSMNQNQ